MQYFAGNLTQDPDYSTTQGGHAFARIRFAVSKRYRDKNGAWQSTDPVYWSGEAWDETAEQMKVAGLAKGSAIVVIGEIAQAEWEDGGEKKTRRFVQLKHIGLDLARVKKDEAEPRRDYSASAPVDAASEWPE